MAFRELRSFTEIMRSLGYPRLISMENFRLPNFELVADCLYWLVQRFYPGTDISDEISTEADRVHFLQAVAQVMLTKARMKLNIKKLYSADGAAVRELLKVASLLYRATEKAATDEEDGGDGVDHAAVAKAFNPRDVKAVAAEIIRAGAALYDALGVEPELRDARARAVAGHVDTDFVERSIHEAVGQVDDHVRSLERQLDELERNERTLEAKIEKKRAELERNEKRLATLQSVRPAYMDEYERLQAQLNDLYGQYLDRFRNLEFLEHELEAYYAAEQEAVEAQERRLKRLQKRLAAEELRILRGEQEVNEAAIAADLDSEDDEGSVDGDDDVADQGGGRRGGGGVGGPRPDAPYAKRASMNRRPGGGGTREALDATMRPGQVVGRLSGFDNEDEASIEEDENSDGGDVSLAGSEGRGSLGTTYGMTGGGGGASGGGGVAGRGSGYGAATTGRGSGYGGGGAGYGGAGGGYDTGPIEDDDDF